VFCYEKIGCTSVLLLCIVRAVSTCCADNFVLSFLYCLLLVIHCTSL